MWVVRVMRNKRKSWSVVLVVFGRRPSCWLVVGGWWSVYSRQQQQQRHTLRLLVFPSLSLSLCLGDTHPQTTNGIKINSTTPERRGSGTGGERGRKRRELNKVILN
jgi:hypothetical protein